MTTHCGYYWSEEHLLSLERVPWQPIRYLVQWSKEHPNNNISAEWTLYKSVWHLELHMSSGRERGDGVGVNMYSQTKRTATSPSSTRSGNTVKWMLRQSRTGPTMMGSKRGYGVLAIPASWRHTKHTFPHPLSVLWPSPYTQQDLPSSVEPSWWSEGQMMRRTEDNVFALILSDCKECGMIKWLLWQLERWLEIRHLCPEWKRVEEGGSEGRGEEGSREILTATVEPFLPTPLVTTI